ncbi:toprim domain-containing protein [Exiguobacterium undae]|uniref:toprim domain-containing protein n=1 Tax=Exiguobacterium undae TaxID=169177 RepID=UPI000685180D|nr:toprim domain-containing protein [Exiguobacterium undae]
MQLTKSEFNEIMALIDVEEELREFEWPGANWSQDKLIAKSPFRYDHSPSFFVNLTGDLKGVWVDSGATDDRYAKGGWLKLLAHLREISIDEVVDEYRGLLTQRTTTTELPQFKLGLRSKVPKRSGFGTTGPTDVEVSRSSWNYLQGRGISTQVSVALRISYDPARKAIVIPWFGAKGDLVAMKYRSTRDKKFWYAPGGRPISELVYGIDRVYKRQFKTVCVVEAEIDAMSLVTAGVPAVATGGAAVSRAKIDVLRGSPVERFIIVPDTDGAGERWAAELDRGLKDYAEVRVERLGARFGVKDANDVLVKEVKKNICHRLVK